MSLLTSGWKAGKTWLTTRAAPKALGLAKKPGVKALAPAVAGGAAMGAAGSLLSGGGGNGEEGEYRRHRRARGISASEYRIAVRTMKKIIKLYNKLPKRASRGACRGRARSCR